MIVAAKHKLSDTEYLEELLTEYGDIFYKENDDHGRTDRVNQSIDTGDARPIRQLPRRITLAKLADVCEMLDDMQRRGFIQESGSPWSSHFVLLR